MVRNSLSVELIEDGSKLLALTDDLGLQAQGAMWLFDHSLTEWRYYLVTSMVDTRGRRKTFGLLLDAFEHVNFPGELSIEDIYLASPSDPLFQLLARAFFVAGGWVRFENVTVNGFRFDAVVYRMAHELPTERESEQIEKRFTRRVKDLQARRA